MAALCFLGMKAGRNSGSDPDASTVSRHHQFLVERERMDPIVSPEQNTSFVSRGHAAR